jgi:hypothetical protein
MARVMERVFTSSQQPAEHRQGARTHLFVIATLCWNGGSAPVHVRNMSAKGALIESAILPAPGSRVVLKRGSLEAGGHIAWAASRKAGLALGATVNVSDWMIRRACAHQDRIDEIVAELKFPDMRNGSPAVPAEPSVALPIETELALLRADLIQLGNGLAADVILVATHPEIQLIDIALQRVERLMRAMENAD